MKKPSLILLGSLALLLGVAPSANAAAGTEIYSGVVARLQQTSADGCLSSQVLISSFDARFRGKDAPAGHPAGELSIDVRDTCNLTIPTDCEEDCEAGPTLLLSAFASLEDVRATVDSALTSGGFAHVVQASTSTGATIPVAVDISWSAVGSATARHRRERLESLILVSNQKDQPAVADVRVVADGRTIAGITTDASLWENSYTWIPTGK